MEAHSPKLDKSPTLLVNLWMEDWGAGYFCRMPRLRGDRPRQLSIGARKAIAAFGRLVRLYRQDETRHARGRVG